MTEQLEKEYLVNLLNVKGKFSVGFLKNMEMESLKKLYNSIFGMNSSVFKRRIAHHGLHVRMILPQKICDKLNLRYGDRFDLKVSKAKKTVFLYPADEGGSVKIGNRNVIKMPESLIHYGFVTDKDDVIVYLDTNKDGKQRIVIQSVSTL